MSLKRHHFRAEPPRIAGEECPRHFLNSRRNAGRLYIEETFVGLRNVVAHYSENLTWLAPIANRGHVYHKGKNLQPPPLPLYAWERLTNVGRESHTYLYHIINNYETLPEVTGFIQGEGLSRSCFASVKMSCENLKQNKMPAKFACFFEF